MLSGRLVQSIADNWEEIAVSTIRKIRRHPEMDVLGAQSDAELRAWCREILEKLGEWLTARSEDEVKTRFESAGVQRFEEAVPLHEAVARFQLLKNTIIAFVHDEAVPAGYLQLYAEEELESRVTRFFDMLVYYVVRGYEQAMRRAARYA